MIEWYCYVPRALQDAYTALGWVYECELGPHGREYRIIMRWNGEGPPREPHKESTLDG